MGDLKILPMRSMGRGTATGGGGVSSTRADYPSTTPLRVAVPLPSKLGRI
jgi:hypothetical protein